MEQPNWSELDHRISRVVEDIRETKNAQQRLDDKFQIFQEKILDQLMNIHKAISAVGKPQYAVITGFAVVVLAATGGIYNLAISPINDKLADYKEHTARLDSDLRIFNTQKADIASIADTKADFRVSIDELNKKLDEIRQRFGGSKKP